jgi:phage N-6-adenine-methyltransferase
MNRQAANAKQVRERAQLPAEQLNLLPGYSQALEMIKRAAHVDEAKEIADKASAFRAYAIKARNREMEFSATEIRMWAERRMGELIKEDRANGLLAHRNQTKRMSWAKTYADLGITRDEAARWQRMARLSEHDFKLRLEHMRANGKPGSFLDTAFSSDSDEWLTPKEILDHVLSVLGSIDLDPCGERGDDRANIPAGAHFTKKDDGLSKAWTGAVYINPPYSDAAAFIEKLITEWREGRVTQAIALLPSRTDTAWFRAILAVAPVCFIMGRIIFKLPTGELAPTGAPFPSAISYLGPNRDRFAAVFSPHFGPICREGI